jgi:hypothetical protein
VALNAAFVVLCGLAAAGVSALFALAGSDLSVTLLAVSFLFGAFGAWVAIGRHGSAAEVWRRLRQPPR